MTWASRDILVSLVRLVLIFAVASLAVRNRRALLRGLPSLSCFNALVLLAAVLVGFSSTTAAPAIMSATMSALDLAAAMPLRPGDLLLGRAGSLLFLCAVCWYVLVLLPRASETSGFRTQPVLILLGAQQAAISCLSDCQHTRPKDHGHSSDRYPRRPRTRHLRYQDDSRIDILDKGFSWKPSGQISRANQWSCW